MRHTDLEGKHRDQRRDEAVCNPLAAGDGEARRLHQLRVELLEEDDLERVGVKRGCETVVEESV